MLDLRRTAAPLRAACAAAFAAALIIMYVLLAAPGARAAGELAAFGPVGFDASAGEFAFGGPVAVDPSDGNDVYVADVSDASRTPRVRKLSPTGQTLATVAPPNTNAGGGAGYIAGLAVDQTEHRLYVLMVANGPDTANPSQPASMSILAYSTVPQANTLIAPANLSSGVLVDFRTAGGVVDYPTGIAVDPTTHKVGVIGIDDPNAIDPNGVIQYVTDAGALSTPLTGLGTGVDPDGDAVPNPPGMAIGPDGDIYVPELTFAGDGEIYRIPKGGGTPRLIAQDPVDNNPTINPAIQNGNSYGVPIAVSPDGTSVWIPEGVSGSGMVRGFSIANGDQLAAYGGGTAGGSCYLPFRFNHLGIGVGADDQVIVTSPYNNTTPDPTDRTVHVFGPGGSGCPVPQGLFTVDGRGDGSVTITKGKSIVLDASMSDLRGGAAGEVDWDLDGSGQFATHVTGTGGAAAALTINHTYLNAGATFRVGVKIHIQGSVWTEPVFHTVTVAAPRPIASFTPSTRTPAAGGTVTFDASASIDSAGSDSGGPTHTLKTYHWEFGDGATQDTTTPTVTHAFANGGTASVSRTVKLVVTSRDDVASDAFAQTVTVAGTANATPTPTPTPAPRTTPAPPSGGGTVPPTQTIPSSGVSGSSVDARGNVALTVSCPAGGARCVGRIVLKVKVTKTVRGRKKATTVTIGTVSFTVDAGKSKAVKLRLTATGRSLLRKQKRLSVTAAITTSANGRSSTRSKALTLKAPSKNRK